MKKWPAKDETVYFSDLVKSITDVIKFGYELKRKNKNKNIPYKGYNIDNKELSGDFDPVNKLRVKNLKYSEEEQGRDLLNEAVGIAVQLGIAQGRRLQRNTTGIHLIIQIVRMMCNDMDKKTSKLLLKMLVDTLKREFPAQERAR